MIVRRATEADKAALYAIAQLAHAAGRYSYMPFSPSQAHSMIGLCIMGGNFVAMVAEADDGALAGAVLAFAVPAPLGEGRIASEFFSYLHPERRGGRAAGLLWPAVLDWCREAGVLEMIMDAPEGERFEEVTRLYRHMDFTHQGELWVRRL